MKRRQFCIASAASVGSLALGILPQIVHRVGVATPTKTGVFLFKYRVRLHGSSKVPTYCDNMKRVVLTESEEMAKTNLFDYTDKYDKGVPEIESVTFLGTVTNSRLV